MFAILQAAGWPIWFLLAASVIAVALIIERSLSLRSSRIIPPRLLRCTPSTWNFQPLAAPISSLVFLRTE